MRLLPLLAGIAAMLATPALAQETERYRMERTEDGFVRMDTTTGQMSVCQEQSGQLVCRTATDERLAYEDRIDDLERRVEALESAQGTAQNALPSEQEFEQSLGYMRRFFQSFFDIVREWENDPRTPQPDRT
ncbi:hypothetical protein GTW25_02130 [Aliihoeflea aestuarii]|jgi:hypothetical protein|uniref:hypothetical protein n=1 Tax=Aliihoeflea aestuarii TaxID=453840 RepID=UPI0020937371|nr:hypothetical protein [Aliihoeflea aestuarii]MCO6389826.1 hypothetical protein [Aliihoeflea aestuarii]